MAIDFYTALRSRARSQERKARLTGRPLTQEEASAPYTALAETAGERLRAGKSVELAERGQVTQEKQFGETLEETRIARAESSKLEQLRIAEAKKAEEARLKLEQAKLKEQKRATNLQLQAAQEAGEVSTGKRVGAGAIGGVGGAWAGMKIGAAIGSSYPGVGTVVGGILGFIGGYFGGGGCIIISACTNPYSYEVNLARKFRDRFMGPETLIGYYAIASVLAPLIDKFRAVRWLVYRVLVKRLVDYGEWIFEGKEKPTKLLSKTISESFLILCGKIGRRLI